MLNTSNEEVVKKFIDTYQKYVHRDGSAYLLEVLVNRSNFFKDPASTKYHLAHEGGLVEHSLNVYNRLVWLVSQDPLTAGSVSSESIAIVGLLHDVCKADTYRHQSDGSYKKDDLFPYGHGEKSVYQIMKYMNLTDEEVMAIRYHMGSWNEWEKNDASEVFKKYSLAFLLHVADEWATFIDEEKLYET